MLQAANQALGSPSNRVNITAKVSLPSLPSFQDIVAHADARPRSLQWAARGYALSLPTANRSIASIGLGQWLRDTRDVNIFRLTLAVVDIGFWTGRLSQCASRSLTSSSSHLPKRLTLSLALSRRVRREHPRKDRNWTRGTPPKAVRADGQGRARRRPRGHSGVRRLDGSFKDELNLYHVL